MKFLGITMGKGKVVFAGIVAIAVIMLVLYYSNSFEGSSKNYSSDVNTEEISEDIKDPTIPIEIQAINADMIDEVVVIEGKITKINRHKNGHLFLTVADSTGEIQVPVFADKEIDRDILEVNKKYQIAGEVQEYKGKLEIIPEKKGDIKEISD